MKRLESGPIGGHREIPNTSRKIRQKEMSIALDLEFLSLVDGATERDFLTPKIAMETSLDEYHKRIATRNIFSLRNNPPRLSVSNRSFQEGRPISMTLQGKDDDSGDKLLFELIKSSVDGATLSQSSSGKSATFKLPPLDPGNYEFIAKLSDNGLPSKFVEEPFKITVTKKPAPPKKQDPPPPIPPHKHAGQTAVKFVATPVDGIQRVYIRDMITEEKFELAEGESFKLDDKEWKVHKITKDSVEIEVDGKRLKFQVGARLDEPVM